MTPKARFFFEWLDGDEPKLVKTETSDEFGCVVPFICHSTPGLVRLAVEVAEADAVNDEVYFLAVGEEGRFYDFDPRGPISRNRRLSTIGATRWLLGATTVDTVLSMTFVEFNNLLKSGAVK